VEQAAVVALEGEGMEEAEEEQEEAKAVDLAGVATAVKTVVETEEETAADSEGADWEEQMAAKEATWVATVGAEAEKVVEGLQVGKGAESLDEEGVVAEVAPVVGWEVCQPN
jgi:hypothetical protein